MGIEVFIEEDFNMYAKKVYVIENQGSKTIHYNIDKEGQLVTTEVGNNPMDNNLKPFMIMPREIGDAILLAFTKALAAQGIRTENEYKIEGELIATKAHLEDIRKVAFKGLKI